MTLMPAAEDLLDVLVALGVLHAGDVGVGELVDEHDVGRRARIASRSISSSERPR